jgi:dipeptidyl aminopeptidase/acylaminoacyl peptidase
MILTQLASIVRRVVPAALLLLLAFALSALLAFAQSGRGAGFTLEQVMSAPFPSDLTAQPKGKRIAWAVSAKGVRNVWIADAPPFAARQVTHYTDDDGGQIASVRLTPDGRTVIYVRGSETNSQGEVADPTSNVQQPKQQVWAVDVDGDPKPRLIGDVGCGSEGCEDVEISPDGQWVVWPAKKQLWIAPVSGATPAKELAYIRGDNDDPKWSPDGKQIVFVSGRGDHSFIGVYDVQGSTIRWISPTVDRDSLPRWSRDGKQIAFVRTPGRKEKQPIIPIVPVPWSIWVADAAMGKAQRVWRSGNEENASFPRLTADASFHFANGRVVFAYEQDGWNHLYSVPSSGGKEVLLTPGDFDVEHVSLSADGTSILYSSNQDDVDRRHIWRVSAQGGKPQQLTRGETSEFHPIETGDGKTVVCLGSSGTTPAMPYAVTSSGRKMIAAESLPADFPSAQLVEPKQVTFKAEDGWTIHGQLFIPKGRTAPGPALLFMHGGSKRQMLLGFHYMYYYHNAYAENQYLASLGYVVLSVNYRTGIMYGRAFREPADGGWRGGSEYKDIVAAAKYLQTLPIVDAKKIGLWGGSYGGYLTAMGLARNSDIFAAGVDMHGVHDWSARTIRAGETAPDAREAAKLAFESSPNSSISKWKSPVLLIQGDDDRNVAFSQTVDLVQRLREQHVPFEQLVFPDDIHDFLLWRNWVRAYAAGADFFDRVLKRGESIASGE